MSRFATFVFVLVALAGSLFAVSVVGQGLAEAGTSFESVGVDAPTVCTYTPLQIQLTGDTAVETMRPFAPSTNESYLQFAPSAPITPTATSEGYVLLYGGMAGTVSSGISGTFRLDNLNGIAIADGGIARGFLANNLIITDTVGSMNMLLAVNFSSAPAGAPFYPRFLTGYVQSISGTGGYASKRFVGTLTAVMLPPIGAPVRMNATIDGKLYEGFPVQDSPYFFSGSRVMIPNKPVTLQATDVLARFVDSDMQAGGTNGNVNPVSVFTGTTGGDITTTFELDTHSLLVGDSLTFSPGWIVGNWRGKNAAGDTFYGPLLGDLPGVAFHGYFFQAGGTGVFANSHIFTLNEGAIAYQGGQDIAGGSTGYYCTDMVNVGPTLTSTPTSPAAPTSTSITPASPTSTRTHTATATRTHTPLPTQTPGGATATPEPTQTNTVVPTATMPPVETSTSTSTPITPTATATACTMRFQDVPEGSTFYAYVMCLACHGIVSGYECGGVGEPCGGSNDPYFRPGNSVTRGQITKIVALAAGFVEPVSGQTFEDVVPGSTFYEYVQRLAERGIMNGYPCGGVGEPCVPPGNRPYFRPNAQATRGQLAKIVCFPAGCKGPVGFQTFEDVLPDSTFYEDIEALVKWQVFSGYPCGGVGEPCVPPENKPYFRPGHAVTRGQTSKIVRNTLVQCDVR